jgi:hypothetical protein
MRCVWAGSSGAPATGATNYQSIGSGKAWAWGGAENNTGGSGGKSVPLTENIIITKLTVWVGTAPGGVKTWTFKVRKNAADTTASVTITGAATTSTWTGQLACSASDLINLSSTPSGTPTGAVSTFWNVEYYTTGNYYLVLACDAAIASSSGTYYYPAFSGNTAVPTSVTTDYETVIPTSLTVTKIAVIADQSVGGTYTYSVRNNTTATDSSFSAAITTFQGISAAGSLAFSPGDCMVIKEVRSGTAWAGIRTCITVAPSFMGEIVQGYGNLLAPSTTVTNYDQALGIGSGAWNATETAVYMRMPGSIIKKLYVKLATAPGASKSRAFTIRSNVANTTVTTTISGAAVTTGNDTVNSAAHIDGNFLSMSTTPTGTPAATAGVKFGFVQVIDQRSNKFFSMF